MLGGRTYWLTLETKVDSEDMKDIQDSLANPVGGSSL